MSSLNNRKEEGKVAPPYVGVSSIKPKIWGNSKRYCEVSSEKCWFSDLFLNWFKKLSLDWGNKGNWYLTQTKRRSEETVLEIAAFLNQETLLDDPPLSFSESSSIYFYNLLLLIIPLGQIWFYESYYTFLKGDNHIHLSILHITTWVVL